MEEVKKKKKAYVKPEMHVEEFTPNEYIASACWNIACYATENYSVRGHQVNHGNDGKHGCTLSANQFIKENNNTFTMVELNTVAAGNKELPCTITSPNPLTLDYVKSGGEIQWTTSATYDDHVTVTWKHKGKPVLQNPARPLHS